MPGVEEYVALVTSEHRRPRFLALVEACVRPFAEAQAALAMLPAAFGVDTAIGAQLDAVGLWEGVTRYLQTPLEGVYFSWDVADVGWEEGVWKGRYDPSSGLSALDDESFRLLIRARIVANHWDGSVPLAYAAWRMAFAGTGSILVIQDNQDMSMSVGIAGIRPDAVFRALLVGNYIPIKPEGVRINWYAVTPDGGKLFAWDCEADGLAGWADAAGDGGRWPEYLVPRRSPEPLRGAIAGATALPCR